MVLQREQPVYVWGFADPKETVTVAFRGAQLACAANELGRWSVDLPPGIAGGPFVLSVKGTNSITVNDVLVGDVWIASGQSNMGFSVNEGRNAAEGDTCR